MTTPFILMDVCEILRDAGFRCHEACSGDEALALLTERAEGAILLFTDVEMPGSINGFELAHVVAERWPAIEIVVASGKANPKAGALPEKATFISKPFSAELVTEHLKVKLPDGKKPEPLKRAI